ncbi:YbaB/EbfC family nucleoid-associated protein [Bartonella sp. B30(2025)]
MRNIMNMMKNTKEMQKKMQKIQQEIANLEVTGIAGGGLISITLNGKNLITVMKIDPSLLNPEEAEMLEDLIMAAYNDARAKLEIAIAEMTQRIAAGFTVPAAKPLF